MRVCDVVDVIDVGDVDDAEIPIDNISESSRPCFPGHLESGSSKTIKDKYRSGAETFNITALS